MDKCEGCGVKLSDDCVVVWKCPECGKAFKVSFSKLHKIQEWKRKNVGKYLLKCSSCGYVLNDGNEKIVCKCSSCGNVFGGNLTYFVSSENNTDNHVEINTGNSDFDMIECPECGMKILNNSKICGYCGYPLKESIKQVNLTPKINKLLSQYKKNIVKIAFPILSFMCVIAIGVIIYNVNAIKQNSAYDEGDELLKNSITDSTHDSSSYEDSNLDSDDSSNSSTDNYKLNFSNSSSSYSSGSSSKTIEHYCEADGCYKEGTKAITGFSGKAEYYCNAHYQEIQDIISMMEEDVGSGAYSKHQCEECSKEGTRELIGFSGKTEYYCTEHYNEIVEIINMLYGDE